MQHRKKGPGSPAKNVELIGQQVKGDKNMHDKFDDKVLSALLDNRAIKMEIIDNGWIIFQIKVPERSQNLLASVNIVLRHYGLPTRQNCAAAWRTMERQFDITFGAGALRQRLLAFIEHYPNKKFRCARDLLNRLFDRRSRHFKRS